MYTSTNESPATALTPTVPGTGTGAQATTRPPTQAERMEFAQAMVAYLDAQAAYHRAGETMNLLAATAYELDPHTLAADRMGMAEMARDHAKKHALAATEMDRRANLLRPDPAPAATTADEPCAVVVVTVQRDRIQCTARLMMGGTRTVNRTWNRVGASAWKSRDPEFIDSEDRIGIELAEFVDSIDLPDRVAAMLPRRPSADVVAQAAKEVARA